MKQLRSLCFWTLLACCGVVTTAGFAQVSTVSGTVSLITADGKTRTDRNAGIVVWLTPLSSPQAINSAIPGSAAHPKIIQRNKRFETRLLAVEVGSVVDFPNLDPFFHNVFSLFEGKKFDLGLYEAGATRSVQFNRPGVCYIFCNIHSQMSAVVVVVDTPHFVVLEGPGEFRIPQIAPGSYQLKVWAERCAPETLKAASRQVTIGGTSSVGTIVLKESQDVTSGHSNKYGRDYDSPVFSGPIYARP